MKVQVVITLDVTRTEGVENFLADAERTFGNGDMGQGYTITDVKVQR